MKFLMTVTLIQGQTIKIKDLENFGVSNGFLKMTYTNIVSYRDMKVLLAEANIISGSMDELRYIDIATEEIESLSTKFQN